MDRITKVICIIGACVLFAGCGKSFMSAQNSTVQAALSSSSGTVAKQNCTFNGQSVTNGASVTAYQASTVPFGQQCVQESRICQNGVLSGSYGFASCAVGAAAACLFNGQTVQNGASVTAYQSATVPFGSACSSVAQSRTCTNGVLSGTYTFASCTVAPATPPPPPPPPVCGAFVPGTLLSTNYTGNQRVSATATPALCTQFCQAQAEAGYCEYENNADCYFIPYLPNYTYDRYTMMALNQNGNGDVKPLLPEQSLSSCGNVPAVNSLPLIQPIN